MSLLREYVRALLETDEEMIARLLQQREASRDSGDVLARAVVEFLKTDNPEVLERALEQYRNEENFFVAGHARSAKELTSMNV